MMHSDSPLIYRALLRRNKMEISKEDSWVLAGLAGLQVSQHASVGTLAREVLDIFSGHPILKSVSRVSFVRRLGGSNRLFVVSSSNKGEVENDMLPGYGCFVNGNGSLMSCRPGVVRYYQSAVDVVDRFVRQNQPPQRSIARIAKMNLGAGLCTGIYERNRLCGFVFLNGSFSIDDLDDSSVGLVLSFLFQALHPVFEPFVLSSLYWALYAQSPVNYIGSRLNPMKLSDCIREVGQAVTGVGVDTTVKLEAPLSGYLIVHGNIGQIIARTMAIFDSFEMARVDVSEQGDFICFNVSSSGHRNASLADHHRVRFSEISGEANALGLKLQCTSTLEFQLYVLKDRASDDPSVDYSVEHG
jgi:hypothetical protein